MDFRIIIAGIIGIVFLILFCRLFSKKSESRKYLKIWQILLLAAFLGGVALFCFWFIGNKIYRNGIGELFTDYAEIENESSKSKDNTEAAGGDTLIIVVSVDEIHIGNSVYSNISEAQQKIAEAVTSGKNLRVIDDYALATTYNDLIESIIQMNVSRSSIEEIKQP